MKKIDYDQFLETYQPIINTLTDAAFDGLMFETYGKEVDYVSKQNIKNVWTIVEADGDLYALPGSHFVNRFGYFITGKEWESPNIEVQIS